MKVSIIGSSLSSLTLAKALVNQKINVHMFSSKKNITISESRTIGITKSNIEYFNKNITKIEKIGWKLNKIEIFSEKLKNNKLLNFENNKEHLFSIFKNYELYNLLEKNLSRSKYFKKKNLKSTPVNPALYDLVFNINHSNYFTKKYFNKKIIKKYNSFAHTTTISHKKTLNRTATQVFTKLGPIAFLPISDTKTSVVYSLNNVKKISKKDLIKLIHKYNFKYKIIDFENINSTELSSLNLRSYYHNNILAFGDLLHKIHPLAGQGFNMTIRDIKTLITIIKKRFYLGLPLDHSVNKEFQKKIRHKNLLFSSGIDFLNEIFKSEANTNNDILTKSIKFIGSKPHLNRIFSRIADKGIDF